jgi:hypothetical protein
MPSKTLGDIVNSALKEVGEPEVEEFTADNILQQRVIEAANNAVRNLVDRLDYDWRLKRTTLVTVDDITTESVAVTKGDATVSSVDSDGDAATNFGSVTTSMWFRVASTQKSYQIATATSSSAFELESTYLDSTATATGYRIFQDTFAISSVTDFGELVIATYGDGRSWTLNGGGNEQLIHVPLAELYDRAGGDPHRDTSGRPVLIAEMAPNSSGQTQFKLWPYPTDTYLIELWYATDFANAASFSTTLFDTRAPSSAYDYVEHMTVAAACMWDEDINKSSAFAQKAEVALNNVIRRENRERIDVGFGVETYRRDYGNRYPTRSGIEFDTVRRRT